MGQDRDRSIVAAAAGLVLACGVAVPGSAATYYVRPDGGSRSQCSGLADAPYPGSGADQACAWDHPFRALPPGGPAAIEGGDTLIIGTGSYMIGFGAPGSETDPDTCAADYAWDCAMTPIPSGPDAAHPTRILGQGWSNGCPDPPELWGTQRVNTVLDLTDSSHVRIECLEITDHSGCVDFHSGGLACERDAYPFGEWADRGIYAEDSSDVVLQHLDIHGLATLGVHAGRLSDWTVQDVRIAGNGWAGWDGDLDGDDSSSGTLLFRRWTVEWNGCAETYPGEQPTGCWAQSAGGYGDGIGTGATRGHWIIEDSAFLNNTSDGLDLLYCRDGSTIEIRRTIAAGNAGNQIKTNGPAVIENTVVVGSCDFFSGRSFTHDVDACRAAGNALSLTLRQGDQVELINSTVTSQGDCLVLVECDTENSSCDGSESLLLRNNILVGHPDVLGGDQTCLVWAESFSHDPADIDYSIIYGVKNDACPGPHDQCGIAPGLVSATIDAFDAHLLATSPAIDAGSTAFAPSDDFDGLARDAQPDIGAYEYRSGGACSLSCSATVPASAEAGAPVTFQGSSGATGCSGGPVYDWDFGDGSQHAAVQSPVHSYSTPGTFTWTMIVTVESESCTHTGSIVIRQPPAAQYLYLIPAVAHASGVSGTQWRTDIAAVNRSGAPASLTLTYYSGSAPIVANADLAHGAAMEWRNLLESLFGLDTAAVSQGALTVASAVPLAISSRTYNQTPGGTFGQYLPAFSADHGTNGDEEGVLPQLRSNSEFRTNVGLVNLGADSETVLVRLFGADGSQLGDTQRVTVEAGRWTQINDIFRAAGAGSHDVAYATVTTGNDDALFWAYASVVDNATGDPTTIPLLVP
jgi:PKD repeat protein